ncbi:MAG: hypothetical protein ACTHQQ_03185 [Solirubrobacteraceae bacterium]
MESVVYLQLRDHRERSQPERTRQEERHHLKLLQAPGQPHGYGFHPLAGYADETREAFAILLRAGNAGSNTAADHVTVIDRALAQIPRRASRGPRDPDPR